MSVPGEINSITAGAMHTAAEAMSKLGKLIIVFMSRVIISLFAKIENPSESERTASFANLSIWLRFDANYCVASSQRSSMQRCEKKLRQNRDNF